MVALGRVVKRQALIMAFSDTFAVIGVVLAIAALALLLTKKSDAGGSAGGSLKAQTSSPEPLSIQHFVE